MYELACREGRAGGYKEFDEAEIEETKRRRKELEEVLFFFPAYYLPNDLLSGQLYFEQRLWTMY